MIIIILTPLEEHYNVLVTVWFVQEIQVVHYANQIIYLKVVIKLVNFVALLLLPLQNARSALQLENAPLVSMVTS